MYVGMFHYDLLFMLYQPWKKKTVLQSIRFPVGSDVRVISRSLFVRVGIFFCALAYTLYGIKLYALVLKERQLKCDLTSLHLEIVKTELYFS